MNNSILKIIDTLLTSLWKVLNSVHIEENISSCVDVFKKP